MALLGPDGKPWREPDPDAAWKAAVERLALEGYCADPENQERLKREAVEALKRRGIEPIFFVGGPYDGKLFTGDYGLMPQLAGEKRFGCWDEEVERLGGTVIQLVRHTYQAREESGKVVWRFVKTEDGPTKQGDRPPPRPYRRKRRG
jgi:hypothetical protein